MPAPATVDVFQAFADQRRLRILRLLRDGEMCVNDLVTVLDLPQATVSQQLARLRRAGLVQCRRDGPWRHYRLATPRTRLHEHMIDCLASCLDDAPELRKDVARAARLRRDGGCCPS